MCSLSRAGARLLGLALALLCEAGCSGGQPGTAKPDHSTHPSDASRAHDAATEPATDASQRSPDARAAEAGSPANPGSCYGRCGAHQGASARCACDLDCLGRADCCADKHELCAADQASAVCTLTGVALEPALCGTDLGFSFEHAGQLEILFGDSYDALCATPLNNDDSQGLLPLKRPSVVPALPPAAPVACGNLLTLDTVPHAGGGQTFAPMKLYEGNTALSLWLSETPLSGFSDGQLAHALFRRGDVGAPLYVGYRDPSAEPANQAPRSVYRVGAKMATERFQNPTAVSVAHYAPQQPEATDYGAGFGSLFVWGRKAFWGNDAREVFLLHQRLPLKQADGSFAWSPAFFAGMRDGAPSWSDHEADALPVLESDFAGVGQLEIAWVAALDKWLMFYGGDLADWIDETANDQPRHGAIHMRMSDTPWGPWSEPAPALWREQVAGFLACDAPADAPEGMRTGCDRDELPDDPLHSYSPGSWAPDRLAFEGCVSEATSPRQPNFVPGTIVPCVGAQRGNLYAPNLLESWTEDRAGDAGYRHAATLYLNLSTWMPYQVILTAISVHLP